MQYLITIRFIIFIILTEKLIETESYAVCSSVTIQGPVSQTKLTKVKECTIIVGYVRILNTKLLTTNNNIGNITNHLFPNLIEITDYLLVFQVQGASSLGELFPRLTLIRGDKLFKQNYALIVFLTNSLLKLDLSSLVEIRRGTVLLSRLYHCCYAHTVNWQRLLTDNTTEQQPTLSLLNSDCGLVQLCPVQCPGGCWSEVNCQLSCSSECTDKGYGCDLSIVNNRNNNATSCCSSSLCRYCLNGSTCLVCAKYRDLISGKCVDECPVSTSLIYEQHSCVRLIDCSNEKNSLVKGYAQLNGRYCIRECPLGYKLEVLLSPSSNFSANVCVKCEDGVCKRDCSDRSFVLKSSADMDLVRNCKRVKRLLIELDINPNPAGLLGNALQHLEEVIDYLVITHNRHLTSLSALRSLRLIRGESLFERRFALFVHTNSRLRELWGCTQINGITILNGAVKFYENPFLCYQDIEDFMGRVRLNASSSVAAEISFNFNGYSRLTCSSKHTIELGLEPGARQISVTWNVSVSDLRRLKGFVLAYVEANANLTADLDEMYDWSSIYIDYDESTQRQGQMSAVLDVEPFTRYAIYLKADLTVDAEWRTSFDYDRLISNINYVFSLPSQPTRVDELAYESLAFDQVNLKWRRPLEPNGIIGFYFIAFAPLKDLEVFPASADSCQLDQNLIDSANSLNRHVISGEASEIAKESFPANESMSNLKKNLLELCPGAYSSGFSYVNRQNKKKLNDYEKNDLISVEDEIYNLAFRRPRISTSPKVSTTASTTTILSLSQQDYKTNKTTSTTCPITTTATFKSNFNIFDLYDIDQNLLKLITRELFSEDEQTFVTIKTSNQTLNYTIYNLKSFGRYIVSVIACQNFSRELLKFSKKFTNNESQNVSLVAEFLNYFPIENYCSKANSITFRTLPDKTLDKIVDPHLKREHDGIWSFKWSKPKLPNGIIFKYNLRFIDVKLNKTQGPLCHALVENLKITLNQFLLKEGHEYLIQVQAVSTSGSGPWSLPLIRYNVPSNSKFYANLLVQIFVVFVILLIILTFTLLILKKYSKIKEKGYFSINSHYYYFRPDEWEVKRVDLVIEERIGSGCFSEVHKGKMKMNEGVYVDCAIKFCGSDQQSRQRLLKEANMMKSINTTHIVKMLGIISRENPPYLILEYMDKGDLKEFLKSFRLQNIDNSNGIMKQEISTDRFYRIAAEIADGMLWLSEHKYVHRDLAARNCLISKEDVIKIADLGLSKDIYQNPIYREKCKALLPIRWMSPESLSDGSSTTKSDVWSYGVVIWEMATYGDNPYSGKENEDVIQFVKGGGRLELPKNAPLKFFIMLNNCLIKEDYKRINFKEILEILDPDLTADFKQSSFYHNDFKDKLITRKNKSEVSTATTVSIQIREPDMGNSDNYM